MKMPDHLGCAVLILAVLPFGCGSAKVGPRPGAAERSRQITALEQENQALQARVRELESRTVQGRKAFAVTEHDLLPRPVTLAMASGSVVRGGEEPVAEIRLRTTDARGRFVQSTGPVKVVLVAIDMDGVPHQLAAVEIDPDDVRQALREGFMGTAYVFEMPIGNQASHLPKTFH